MGGGAVQTVTLFAGSWQPLRVPGVAAAGSATWPDLLFCGSSLALAVAAASVGDVEDRVIAACTAVVCGVLALIV
jgi:hypothetical protein